MKNSLLLSVNVGILLSYIFTYYCHDKIIDYSDDLSCPLRKKYEKIRKERMTHFVIGIVLAIVISIVYYYLSLKTPTPLFEKTNIILLILLLVPMVVYKILPKSDYMLKHSQKDQDYKDWFNIYLCMKNKSVYGFLCGFTASMVLLNLINIE
jgi:amino acid transporter